MARLHGEGVRALGSDCRSLQGAVRAAKVLREKNQITLNLHKRPSAGRLKRQSARAARITPVHRLAPRFRPGRPELETVSREPVRVGQIVFALTAARRGGAF